jgi:hypothetical protein
MERPGDKDFFWRAVVWTLKHFLASWGIVFAVAMIVMGVFGLSGSIGDVWFLTAAPFMFVVPLAQAVGSEYGEIAERVVWVGSITAIYIGMDVALWTVIRWVRRTKAAASQVDRGRVPGPASRVLLGVAWLLGHWFPLWAIVTAVALFIGYGLRVDFYEPNIKGFIVYAGSLLVLPLCTS